MDGRVQYEQEILNKKVKQIDMLLNNLSNRTTVITNSADLKIIERRKEKIERIKQARSSPYIGRMEVQTDDGKRISYYIGKTAIGDETGTDEIVIDWRSDFGQLYTTYSGGKKKWPRIGEVVGKRQINIDQLKVNRVIDVGEIESPKLSQILQQKNNEKTPANQVYSKDQFLSEVLSQTSEEYKLQEIISSLQEEQDEIIRLSMDQPVIVQGVAGSGKSSVAMHRISYLLFRYEKVLKPENIIVIAPNKTFISYLQSILPELDIQGIKQDTFLDFAQNHLKLKGIKGPHLALAQQLNTGQRGAEAESVARYKGSMAFKKVLELYLNHVSENDYPRRPIKVNEYFTISADKIREIQSGYKHLPINERRNQVLKSIQMLIEEEEKIQHRKIDRQFDDSVLNWVNTLPEENPVRKNLFNYLEQAAKLRKDKITAECKQAIERFSSEWEKNNAIGLYKQMLDEALLTGLDPNINPKLARGLCESVDWEIAYEDLSALLYIEQRLNGISESYQYMIIDEAQDLSPFQMYMLKQIANSVTILGDISQSIFSTGIRSWKQFDQNVLGTSSVRFMQMDTSYRSTNEIMSVANKVIENSRLSLPKIIPVNRKGGNPTIRKVADGSELLSRIMESLDHFKKKGFQKVAIIGKDLKQTEGIYKQLSEIGVRGLQLIDSDSITLKENLILIPSYMVKGLEFDAVIIPNANNQRFSLQELDAKLLYICVTRAHHDLHIYYHGTLTPLLQGLEVQKTNTFHALDEIL